MKFLMKVLERWQTRKEDSTDVATGQKKSSKRPYNLYSNDDDLGFC